MEAVSQPIEAKILAVKARGDVPSDKLGEQVLLQGETKKVFVEAVSEGLRVRQNLSEYYLDMGRHLAKHKPKLKQHRIYGAACQELCLRKSTADNILKLYEMFGDQVSHVISLISVRKLLVIRRYKNLGRAELIKYCEDNVDEIGRLEGIYLRAWVKGEPRPELIVEEQTPVDSFTVKKKRSKRTVTVELCQADGDLQTAVRDYLCECMKKFDSWRVNRDRSEGEEVGVASPAQAAATPEAKTTTLAVIDEDAAAIMEFLAGQNDSTPAQVIPFPQKSEEDQVQQKATEGPGLSDSLSVAQAGAGDSRDGVMVLE